MAERAVDHTTMSVAMKEIAGLTGAVLHGAVDTGVGQKLNRGSPKHVDYVKEASEAQTERNADDRKFQKPLADAMVGMGYLHRKGPSMAERAVDHTKMPAANMKEIAGSTGVKLQDGKLSPIRHKERPVEQLNHLAVPTDYVKEAIQAHADRDADDSRIEKPLADEMKTQGFLRAPGAMAQRAVDHTNMPKPLNGNANTGVGQKLSPTAQAARIAQGQADFLKDAIKATAMKDKEDAAVEAPLAKQMVKEGYLKPHNIISNLAHPAAAKPFARPLVTKLAHNTQASRKSNKMDEKTWRIVNRSVWHDTSSAKESQTRPCAGKPFARPPIHPVTKLAPNTDASLKSKKEEAERLLRIVNRSVYHDTSSAKESQAQQTQSRQTKLLKLAMTAEKEKTQEDRKTANSISIDVTAEKNLSTRTSLSMRDTIRTSNKLIENAIKEQDEEMDKGKAEMRIDDAALVNSHDAMPRKVAAKTGNNLFKQALKEANADHAKGEAARNRDLSAQKSVHTTSQRALAAKGNMNNVQKSLIQQAIAEKDSDMHKGMLEEEKEERIAKEVHVDTSGDSESGNLRVGKTSQKSSLLKLARQAMGEIDQDEEARHARQIHDDEAESVVHKEHLEARQEKELRKEVSGRR